MTTKTESKPLNSAKNPPVSSAPATSANVSGNTAAAQAAANNSAWMTWAVQLLQKSMPDAMKQALIESLKKAESDEQGAKHDAVKRLRAVLMHDRSNISPLTIESIRSDILTVISKYLEVDQETMDLHLEQDNNRIALVANIAMIRERELAEIQGDAAQTDTKSETPTPEAKKGKLEKAVEDKQDKLMDDLLQSSDNAEASEAS